MTFSPAANMRDRRVLARQYRDLAKANGCVRCGKPGPGLHFHHRSGTVKIANPGEMLGYALDSFLAELEKCDVLCATCHAQVHHPMPEHGTITRYNGRLQCRCAECRAAWAGYMRERERRRQRADEPHAGVESPVE